MSAQQDASPAAADATPDAVPDAVPAAARDAGSDATSAAGARAVPDVLPDAAPGPLAGLRVAVVGLGVMGRGIARVFDRAGARVLATDANPQAVAAGSAALAKEAERDGENPGVRYVETLAECVAGAELVVEAISESPDLKHAFLAELAPALGEDAIVASNTSSLSIGDLGRAYGRPGRLVGMHFFNPATKMPLVEVVRGPQTDPDVVRRAVEIGVALGKTPVECADSPGFIVNRTCRPLYYEGQLLVSQGVAAAVVDAVARAVLGYRMGPLETIDLAGLHTHLAASETVLREFGDPRYRPIPVVRALVRSGATGRGAGRGFYDYAAEPPRQARERVLRPHERTEPVPVAVTGPLAGRVGALLADAGVPLSDDADIVVHACRGPEPADVAAVRERAAGGATVLVDSTHGGWATELPAEAGWLRLHRAADGGVFAEVVDDAQAAIAPPPAVDRLLGSLGATSVAVPAVPGLVAERLLMSVINEAALVVEEGTATPGDVDTALRLGMNHRRGPFELARAHGLERVLHGLRDLQECTGDPRYRPTSLIVRWVGAEHRSAHGGADRLPPWCASPEASATPPRRKS